MATAAAVTGKAPVNDTTWRCLRWLVISTGMTAVFLTMLLTLRPIGFDYSFGAARRSHAEAAPISTSPVRGPLNPRSALAATTFRSMVAVSKAVAQPASSVTPSDPYAAIDASLEDGDTAGARTLLAARLAANPDDDRALVDLAWITPKAAPRRPGGQPQLSAAAQALLLRAVAANPGNRRAAQLLLDQADRDGAGSPLLAQLTSRQEDGQGSSELAQVLASYYSQHGQPQQAAHLYEAALAANPTDTREIKELLAASLAVQGDGTSATAYYETLLEQADSPEYAAYLRGRLLALKPE